MRRFLLLAALAACAAPAPAGYLNPTAFASLGTLNLGAGTYTIDTAGPAPTLKSGATTLFTGVTVAQASTFNPTVAVFTFGSINIQAGAVVTAVGPNPLALLSQSTATLAGTVHANGVNGGDSPPNGGTGLGGAGGAGGGKGSDGSTRGSVRGAGPGGGFPTGAFGLTIESTAGGGGHGGMGGWYVGNNVLGGPTYGDLNLTLQGGSGGAGSNGDNFFNFNGIGAGAGGGGGGIEFGAVGAMTFANTGLLTANGGAGGTQRIIDYYAGGGSGGGLLLHADSIALNGVAGVRANGGGRNGGGGRILFLTASGGVSNVSTIATASGSLYGQEGVIEFGRLSGSGGGPGGGAPGAAAPLPATWLLGVVGATAVGLLRRR